MSALDAWLDEASFALGGTLAQQQAMRDELRADIEAAAREHELQGCARDEAMARALADMGVAAEVGRAMRASRRGALRRPLVQPDGALILERRVAYHLPHRALALALAAGGAAAAVVTLRFLWPG